VQREVTAIRRFLNLFSWEDLRYEQRAGESRRCRSEACDEASGELGGVSKEESEERVESDGALESEQESPEGDEGSEPGE
jgi:hypothetical protein